MVESVVPYSLNLVWLGNFGAVIVDVMLCYLCYWSMGTGFTLFSGIAFNLFTVDRPQPWWPFGSGDCPYVQDWQEQVRDHRKELDSEVCYGLVWAARTQRRAFCPCGIDLVNRCMNGVICSSHKWTNRESILPSERNCFELLICYAIFIYKTLKPILSLSRVWNPLTTLKKNEIWPHKVEIDMPLKTCQEYEPA